MHATPSPTPTPDPEEAWLEDLLRRAASTSAKAESTECAQFTDRVLAALPPSPASARRRARRRRTLLVAGASLAGAAAAWALGGAGLAQAWHELLRLGLAAGESLQRSDSSLVTSLVAGISLLLMLLLGGRGTLRRLWS